ncbi:MAG: HypC/HybG/HupF family hydrogenase formation chaperone [Gemmatimonadaceae bacterium]
MKPLAAPACDEEYGCITCSDQGILMRVTGMAGGLAQCADPAGNLTEIDAELIDGVNTGDVLLVHAGVALARVGNASEAVA